MKPAAVPPPRSVVGSPTRWKSLSIKKGELPSVALKRKRFQERSKRKKLENVAEEMDESEEPEQSVEDPETAEIRQEVEALSSAAMEIEKGRARQRMLSAEEIVSTERTYVEKLLLLIKVPCDTSRGSKISNGFFATPLRPPSPSPSEQHCCTRSTNNLCTTFSAIGSSARSSLKRRIFALSSPMWTASINTTLSFWRSSTSASRRGMRRKRKPSSLAIFLRIWCAISLSPFLEAMLTVIVWLEVLSPALH